MKKRNPLFNRHTLSNIFMISLGILSATFGIKGFLLSSHFIDGGVTGISMLLTNIFGWPFSILLVIINLPFLWIGYNKLGTLFTIKSAIAITGLAFAIAFLEMPDVTSDKLLTAVFGGLFLGTGIALAIRGGAVLDGTEIAALLVSKKAQIVRVNDVILIFNVFIFIAAAIFLSTEAAMYSILTYFAASKMMDFILNGIEQYTGITVISNKSELIRRIVTHQLGRGVTIYQGKSGYGKDGEINDNRDIVFTVATRLEVPAIKQVILEIDPKAFIVLHSIEDTTGGLMKRKRAH